jgi:integrase
VGVRSTDIAAWRSRMVERGYAPTTIRNALTIISQVHKTAASEWGMPELRNPVRGVRLPKHRPGRDRRLEPGEEEALLSAAMRSGCPWLLPAIVISLETAMRRGELLSLRWEDVMPDRVLIRTTKNGRPRVVALSSRARDALAEMPRSLSGNVVPLSGSAGSGRVFPITAPVLDHRWRTASPDFSNPEARRGFGRAWRGAGGR